MKQQKTISTIIKWWRSKDKKGSFNIDLYIKVLIAKGIDV